MKTISVLTLAILLTACSQSVPTETVESLVANPERLKELRQQCKADRAKLGDTLCNAVAEATRKRFYGNGNVPYRGRLRKRKIKHAKPVAAVYWRTATYAHSRSLSKTVQLFMRAR